MNNMEAGNDLTVLLKEMAEGDSEAYQEVFASVYQQLRKLAHQLRWKQHRYETLNTTALVHEAYVKLGGGTSIDWESRSHFFAVAAKAMRYLLSNHARHKMAQKRGGAEKDLDIHQINQDLALTEAQSESLIDLDQALKKLEAFDPRQASIVEHRFYAGLSIEDTAEVMGISPATIKREWAVAKAFLRRELSD